MKDSTITVLDKTFVPFLSEEEIDKGIQKVADAIYEDFKNERPIFIGILNGVVMFFSDLLKKYPGECEIAFMQMKSYEGTTTTGKVKNLLDIPEEMVKDRHIIIVEDIVDTGNTLEALYDMMKAKPIASVSIATLLFKPEAYKKDLDVNYIGFSIPNKFVLGYGLDYDGLARNLSSIYQLKE